MTFERKAICCIIGAVFFVWLGYNLGPTKIVDHPYEKRVVVPAIVKPKPIVQKQELSSACKKAIKLTRQMVISADVLAAVGNRQLDIHDASYKAIINQDFHMLNKQSEQQRAITDATSLAVRDLAAAQSEIKPVLKDCNQN